MMKLIFLSFFLSGSLMAAINPHFVSLSDVCPGIKIQANYSTENNFTGVVVAGYKAKKAYLAKGPAEVLCEIQKAALLKGYSLKIFDAYRPMKAVQHFIDWAKRPEDHPGMKELYYPSFTRQQLFQKGYISPQSSHTRGGSVDLTLFDVKTGKDLDMGGSFDYFDDISTTDSHLVTELQRQNRMLLKEMMESKGFKNFAQEWWHYSFKPEPYPDQAFDFDVE
jgi:D-alanyl-D-alanine dipeptidase